MLKNCYKTAESVSVGHPDAYLDAVVNHILDAYLAQDPNTRFALDGVVKNKFVTLGGEITSTAKVDIPEVVREVTELIGYEFTPEVTLHVYEQSPDIALGTNDEVGGAGDQGTITGYACKGNPRMIPLEKALADELIRVMYINKRGEYDFIKPDMKSQVTLYYNEEGLPIIDTIVFACQHTADSNREMILPILKEAIQEACDRLEVSNNEDAKIILNGTGLFIQGGPEADSGEVGRKIVVDSYGVSVPVGGGTCVDADTEFLTPTGWKKISDYQQGDLVAQWDNFNLQFVKPYAYIEQPAETMYHFKSPKSIDMVLSENHDIVYLSTKGNINKKRVKDLLEQHNYKIKNGFHGDIPLTFNYDGDSGLTLTDDEIKLQIAFCADGCMTDESSPFMNLKRARKKQRLIELLNSTNTPFTQSDYKDGYSRFRFTPPILTKSIKDALLGANKHQLSIIKEELPKWDGDNISLYRTTNKEDADFAQFVFMHDGTQADISVDDRVGYIRNGYEIKSICYSVYPNTRTAHSLKNGNISIEDYKTDMMYCFTVPSGMLLLRRNNKVFVTGNCNGKDCTKVDRSAAYMARYVAKTIVNANLADECLITVSYVIGHKDPVSIDYDFKGTERLNKDILIKVCNELFSFRPADIIKRLELTNPIFGPAGIISHYGLKFKASLTGDSYVRVPWEDVEESTTQLLNALKDYGFHTITQEEK